jgi:YD repeat-containing protein
VEAQYNAANRLASVTSGYGGANPLTTNYTYDALSRPSLTTLPNNLRLSYSYNRRSQLTTLSEGLAAPASRPPSRSGRMRLPTV